MVERKINRFFEDTARYDSARSGLEDYVGMMRDESDADMMVDHLEGPKGEIIYAFSSKRFVVDKVESYVDVEVVADRARKTFDGKVSGESSAHVNDVTNKIMLSLVMGKNAKVKK